MNSAMSNQTIPLDALPSFFKDAVIICPAEEDFMADQGKRAANGLTVSDEEIKFDIFKVTPPSMRMDDNARKIYQSNDFAQIKKLEEKMDHDLRPIYDNINTNSENAWTRVRSHGEEFYMCWSNSGSMWVYTSPVQKNENDTTFKACVQVGTYSKSSGIFTSHDYSVIITTLLAEATISILLAYAISKAIQAGIEFLVSRFAANILAAAMKLGLQRFSCTVLSKVLTVVAGCIVAVLITIAIHFLWEWLNRHYTVCLRIYNWDDKNDWETSAKYLDNAKISGGDAGDSELFSIPKMTSSGSSITPPGFEPATSLDNICYYGAIIWENDKTFMQGCSMALSIKKSGSDEGFMWAFDCPWSADNRQTAKNGIEDPKHYFESCQWSNSPKNFHITATSQNTPVTFGLDSLSGAKDNLYNVQIQINH